MPAYAEMSTDSPEVIEDVIVYGRIVCVCSFGLFLESIWTKVLQANGDMKTPMTAQMAGAVANILILASFSDQAVTALGLYYKWQTFFCIPLSAMQTCIVLVVSFQMKNARFGAENLCCCIRCRMVKYDYKIIRMGGDV